MSNEKAYWLCIVHGSGVKLNKLKPMIQKWYLMEGRSIVDLFNLSITELTLRFQLTEQEAQAIIKSAEDHPNQVKKIEDWRTQGIDFLPLSHPHYPSRLIYALPPLQQPLVLWARGDTAKLTEPTITILGKPEPDTETIAFVQNIAATLTAEQIGIVSGYGRGLDRIAFEAILEAENGWATAVLPMGLSAFAGLTNKLDDLIDAGKALLVSPFPPQVAYKENLAEARNLLVDSLALALLVPDVDVDTSPRAQAALDRGMPVLVGMTDTEENRTLIAKGAFLMTDPGEVVEMVQQAVIDDTLQAQVAQVPASSPPPPKPMLDDDEDDYMLRSDPVEPIDPDEALDILTSMGNVPDSLRAKLRAMEKMSQAENQEEDTP